jgi:7-cyano-7-deazaguanine synthase
MDSCVCAALAAQEHDVHALHFSYGQRTEARELEAARAIAAEIGVVEFFPLSIDLFRRIGGSALTDAAIDVPEGGDALQGDDGLKDGEAPVHEIPVTYVPFRNAHFLAAAVSWAEVLGARAVFVGAVEQDSSGYPDCRPAYYQAFQQLILAGTRAGDIAVETPLIRLRKQEIVKLGFELRAPLHVTWSCYQGAQLACGVCDSCRLRLRAFSEAGYADQIPYARGATNFSQA